MREAWSLVPTGTVDGFVPSSEREVGLCIWFWLGNGFKTSFRMIHRDLGGHGAMAPVIHGLYHVSAELRLGNERWHSTGYV